VIVNFGILKKGKEREGKGKGRERKGKEERNSKKNLFYLINFS